ncbi:phage tail family protein [Kribbella sp. NBC_01505]|uniref:phage distal tail protein n=1 Tax=Kribbella sp. NBC_01505 TaxID=2903580 RepID=UPI00386718F2
MSGPYSASLGSLLLGDFDADGNHWILYDIEGWHAPGSSGETTQRTARHGGWRNRAFYTPRGLTLRGSVVTSVPNVGDILDKLVSAIPLDVPDALTVYGVNTDDRLIYVRQEGDPDIRIVSPREASFSIGLVADDPLKYGSIERAESTSLPSSTGGLSVPFSVPFSIDSVTVSGVAQVDNNGNAATFPRIIIYGPVSDARLTKVATGESLFIDLDIAAGEYLDLDFTAHTAYLNGTASRRGSVSGTWFALDPGTTFVAFNSPTYSADAAAQIIWRDAWK